MLVLFTSMMQIVQTVRPLLRNAFLLTLAIFVPFVVALGTYFVRLFYDTVEAFDNWRGVRMPDLTAYGKPILLLSGLGGFTPDKLFGFQYWSVFGRIVKARGRVFFAPVPPWLNNDIRARFAFCYIKGGTVRLPNGVIGYKYRGQYPQWDSKHPIHVVGHSLGGLTALVLEELIRENQMVGFDTSIDSDGSPGNSSRWIDSITAISAPFNGTRGNEKFFSIHPTKQKANPWLLPRMVTESVVSLLLLIERFPPLKLIYDPHMSWMPIIQQWLREDRWWLSMDDLNKEFIGLSAAGDLNTIESSRRFIRYTKNPNILYMNVVIDVTVPLPIFSRYRIPIFASSPITVLGGLFHGLFLDEGFRRSDGIVDWTTQKEMVKDEQITVLSMKELRDPTVAKRRGQVHAIIIHSDHLAVLSVIGSMLTNSSLVNSSIVNYLNQLDAQTTRKS